MRREFVSGSLSCSSPSSETVSFFCRVSAFRKNVLAKLYGGDVTRKMKVLERQKEGKKRMKMLAGNIQVKPEVFIQIVKR